MAEVITRSLAASTALADGTTLADQLDVRSAGTGPWHEGEPMHPLARTALARAGYPGPRHIAHQIMPPSWAASTSWSPSTGAISRPCAASAPTRPPGAPQGLRRRLGAAADVPDPYYGDDAVFDECRDLIAAGCAGLVDSLATHWDTLWARLAGHASVTGPGDPPVARTCWSGASRPGPRRRCVT